MTDPKPLTTDQLDEIAARAAAATPGPWSSHGDWPGRVFSDGNPNYLHVARTTGWNAEANERFIAHARADVPALLAEVRRLQAELTQYEVLNPQQCPAGKHADWLVDSEYAHACPWCQIEALKGAALALAGHQPAGEQPAAEEAQR